MNNAFEIIDFHLMQIAYSKDKQKIAASVFLCLKSNKVVYTYVYEFVATSLQLNKCNSDQLINTAV